MLVDDSRPPPRYSDDPPRRQASMNSRDFGDRAIHGGAAIRIRAAGPADAEHMHQQNRMDMMFERDPRFFAIKMTLTSLVLIGTIVMIVLTQGAACDENLSTWLVVYALLIFAIIVTTAINFYNYRTRRRNYQTHRVLNFVFLLWWILGQVWVYRTRSCDTALWATVLSLVILEYIRMCTPCILILLLWCCMPCVAPFLDTVSSMKGAEKKEIKKLPATRYKANADNPDDQCSVCLENFKEGDEIRTLPCDHYFHADEIDSWLVLNRTCPLCRKDIGDSAVAEAAAARNGDAQQNPQARDEVV